MKPLVLFLVAITLNLHADDAWWNSLSQEQQAAVIKLNELLKKPDAPKPTTNEVDLTMRISELTAQLQTAQAALAKAHTELQQWKDYAAKLAAITDQQAQSIATTEHLRNIQALKNLTTPHSKKPEQRYQDEAAINRLENAAFEIQRQLELLNRK